MEVWKEIPEYEGLYKVNSSGVVQSRKGTILKPCYERTGFGRITLSKGGVTNQFNLGRLVAEVFDRPRKDKWVVPIDGDPCNVSVDNLSWMNPGDATRDHTAQYYWVKSPIGEVFSIFNMTAFCKKQGLCMANMNEIANNYIRKGRAEVMSHHKGWVCKKTKEELL